MTSRRIRRLNTHLLPPRTPRLRCHSASNARVLAVVSIMAGALGMLISFVTMSSTHLEVILCGGFGFVTGSILFVGGIKTIAQLSNQTATMLPAPYANHGVSHAIQATAMDPLQRTRRQHTIEHMQTRHAQLLQQTQALETRLIELEVAAEVDACIHTA